MSSRYETNWMSKYEQKIIKVLNDLLADEVSPETKRLALHIVSDGAITENGELNNKTCKIIKHFVTPQVKEEIDACLDENKYINAIKILRESLSLSLIEAKHEIDDYVAWRKSSSHPVHNAKV